MKNFPMIMMPIPGGTFLMGSSIAEVSGCIEEWAPKVLDPAYTLEKFSSWIRKEYPAHRVTLGAYEIGKYPVTNGQYRGMCSETGTLLPESIKAGMPDSHPVWGVSFEEAEGFARWFSQKAGEEYRIPTEAEWEFAARGNARNDFPYGPEFDQKKANTIESGIGQTTPVDWYEEFASPFGVCDLAGNVEEWVSDFYRPYSGGDFVEDDLVGALGETYRVLRGGSFARGGDLSRCARRHGRFPSDVFRYTGFRLAKGGPRNVT